MLLSDFITAVQAQLAASATEPWAEWQIEEWTRMTIRELSTVIQRTAVYPLAIPTSGQETFDLDLNVRSLISVKLGWTTLTPASRFDEHRWPSGIHYQLETWDDSATLPTLFLSPATAPLVVAGQIVTVVARVAHDADVSLHEPLTLQEQDLPLLEKGVSTRAYLHVLTNKATDLNTDERNWLRLAWQRVSEDYQRTLRARGNATQSAILPWGL
jgi:hypothetical protein